MDSHTHSASPLKIAILGCGKMGINHAKAIQGCPSGRLVAVVDPAADFEKILQVLPRSKGNPNGTPNGTDVQTFQSAVEMLDAVRPDVVHIVTPPASHAELAKLCLARGAHVYVEKPFTLTAAEASDVIAAARQANRTVCAGHQLLFEPVARALFRELPIIGTVVHVESYFSFKTVRKSRDGRSPMSPVEQLLDILPHPTYTMLGALRASEPEASLELVSLEVRAEGEVRALIRAGEATAMLVVTLRGRPIESYLRVVGTNGCLRADFVRGALTRLPGAGTSAVSILSNPYREGKQILWGSTKGFAHRILGRKKGYPGVTELTESFYQSIRTGGALPISPTAIEETVALCEQVAQVLRAADARCEQAAESVLAQRERQLPPINQAKGLVLVTGGGGLLGRAVVADLRQHGWGVRSIGRRVPVTSAREAGVEYVAADLGQPLRESVLEGVTTIVHCAAETAGGKELHERNTIEATRGLLQSAASAGIKRFLHISSIAVLKPGKGGLLSEKSPVDFDNLGRGPYVWAKAEAEREVAEKGPGLGLTVRIVRPGPLVDFRAYEPPGRLGRELGPLFVAIGPRSGRLSLCDVRTAAKAIRGIVEDFEAAPPVINLIEPEAPTRAKLLSLWLDQRPDLSTFWLPSWVLSAMSPVAKMAQRILVPKSTPIDLAAAFASEQYDATLAAETIRRADSKVTPTRAA